MNELKITQLENGKEAWTRTEKNFESAVKWFLEAYAGCIIESKENGKITFKADRSYKTLVIEYVVEGDDETLKDIMKAVVDNRIKLNERRISNGVNPFEIKKDWIVE